MHLRYLLPVLLPAFGILHAGQSDWINLVSPILTAPEKKAYLALPATGRADFEERFWTGKSITAEEYFRRLGYIDSTFGSTKRTSGANTDPGRVYLSLGAPARITRLASSRIFVPMEIWYYDAVPGLLNTELRLIFFQPNSTGLPRLYSPSVDTIRALLTPQSGAKGMFGPNDSITESDIRRSMNVGPTENEVITAASGLASGIKYSGNEELLGKITSPELMLARVPESRVTSRFLVTRPPLEIVQTPSVYGGSQVDFRLQTVAQHDVNIEVIDGAATIYQNQLHLRFPKPESIEYTHRLDLLPGSYRVVFTVDGKPFPYPIEVAGSRGLSEIFRADMTGEVEHRSTPFEFDGRQFALRAQGKFAVIAPVYPGQVTWMLRKGAQVVWRSTSEGQQVAAVELPVSGIPPGTYRLEAVTEDDSRSADYTPGEKVDMDSRVAAQVSFNANLEPARRLAFIGHQQLLHGDVNHARESLRASLAMGVTEQSQIEMARADALAGQLDDARSRVQMILSARPDNFEALSVYAYVESRLQDYSVAAELYRRALAVQESPALRAALAKLPVQ